MAQVTVKLQHGFAEPVDAGAYELERLRSCATVRELVQILAEGASARNRLFDGDGLARAVTAPDTLVAISGGPGPAVTTVERQQKKPSELLPGPDSEVRELAVTVQRALKGGALAC